MCEGQVIGNEAGEVSGPDDGGALPAWAFTQREAFELGNGII